MPVNCCIYRHAPPNARFLYRNLSTLPSRLRYHSPSKFAEAWCRVPGWGALPSAVTSCPNEAPWATGAHPRPRSAQTATTRAKRTQDAFFTSIHDSTSSWRHASPPRSVVPAPYISRDRVPSCPSSARRARRPIRERKNKSKRELYWGKDSNCSRVCNSSFSVFEVFR